MQRQVFKRWKTSTTGNFSVFAAIAIMPLVIGAGLSVDYIRAVEGKRKYQEALDSAVLAGISSATNGELMVGLTGKEMHEKQLAVAAKVFFANTPEKKNELGDDVRRNHIPQFWFDGETLRGKLNAQIETRILAAVGIPKVDAYVESAAAAGPGRAPICFMARHPTRMHTLELHDSVSLYGPNCNIYGNSDHPDDVVDPHTSDNFITVKSIQAIGYGHHYLENITPPLEHAPEYIPDPLAKRSIPSGSCSSPVANKGIRISGTDTVLEPGVYCDGLKISNAKVKLRDGTYIIKGGDFSLDNARIDGKDVTFVLGDGSVAIDWKDSEIKLEAPRNGQEQGIAIMGVRQEVDHEIENTMIDVHGVIYIPNGAFVWTNKSSKQPKADWTAWIVDGISWEGEGTIHLNFDLDKSKIPYPAEMNAIPTGYAKPRLAS